MSEPTEDEALEKIADLAVQRGYWDKRAALEGVAMARLHKTGPQRQFLRRLLERKCGLTYDELARLEKDALAPPPPMVTPRALPRLGTTKPASGTGNVVTTEAAVAGNVVPVRQTEIVSVSKLPKLATEPREPAPVVEADESLAPKKPLPRLDDAKGPPSGEGSTEAATPRKPLPRLNAPRKPRPESDAAPG